MSNQVQEATELLKQVNPVDLNRPTVRSGYSGVNKTDKALEKAFLRHRSFSALWQKWLARILLQRPIIFTNLEFRFIVDSFGNQRILVTMELQPLVQEDK